MSKLHDIQETAIETAIRDLLVIRPDLDTDQTRALARLVARSAVDELLVGLRAEGLILAQPEDRDGVAPDGRGSKVEIDLFGPLLENGINMLIQSIKTAERDKWDRKRG